MFPLSVVLGLSPGAVVSLVGAGGKSSLLFALVREAVQRWGAGCVLVTTTTHMWGPDPADFPPLPGPGGAAGVSDRRADAPGRAPAVASDRRAGSTAGTPAGAPVPPVQTLLCGTLGEALTGLERVPEGVVPVLARGVRARDALPERVLASSGGLRPKLVGVPTVWVDEIAERFPYLLILVEADGAAGKPLKAPAQHEPVIPSSSRTVLAVAGMDALGAPLDPFRVHRPERVARLTGLLPGEAVTPVAMAQVLWHPEGCARGRPSASRLVPVLNQVDSPQQLGAARRVAARLLDLGASVAVLTTCRKWPVVVEVVGAGERGRGRRRAGGGTP